MKIKFFKFLLIIYLIASTEFIYSSATIPTIAWSRDITASGYRDGAPIGGFGAGTITWKYDGIFYKDRLIIGTGNDDGSFRTDDTYARFYFYQKMASGSAITKKLDASTLGSGQARYYALFPFAWVDYYGSQFNLKAKVTQFSPIIPNDYQRVSYPVGIYEWEISNPTGDFYDAAIMLTWHNNFSGVSATVATSGNFRGIVLHRSGTGAPTLETEGEFALGSISGNGVTVTAMSASSVSALENDFSADGLLSNSGGSHSIGAVAFKVTLAPGETKRIPIVLSWDIPIAQVGSGYKWWKRYTRYFGRTGRNAWGIVQDALTNHLNWEAQIDSWQQSVISNIYMPDWFKQMLFNELYIYFTGGTYWEAGAASGQSDNPDEDMFSHLESYIYDFYGTSDVRFYGSWALFLNWPDIDKQCVKQFCDSVYHNRTDRPAYLNTTAHDFGDRNTLFTQWNAYTYRDSTNWKDLNSKLVLMVYRDWHLTGRTDTAFLNYCWEPVKRAMNKVKSQDTDGDGLPNSNGIDQTYDDMDLTGNTSYCGGLFLAACLAAKQMADAKGDTAASATYQSWYNLAQPNFESKLWTGEYYKIDTGSFDTTRIMSDQLCGQWYAKACGLSGIVSDVRAQSAFQKIYDYNYSRFGNGLHGVVNVMNANGTIDTSTPQTQECWVGTSWGIVSGMLYQGMVNQANNIGFSLYNTIWNTAQYWFRTPEAWRVGVTNPRAFYYMRGSTIWAAKAAYENLPNLCGSSTCTPPPTSTSTFTPTNTPTINPCASSLIRVNCGGGSAVDSQGRTWSADQAYTVGSWGYMGGANENPVSNPIANTQDDILYQSGRWGSNLEYRFTLNNGSYRVRLMWAEIYWSSSGQRRFNVFIEGNQVLSNFDIIESAGGNFTAYERTFDITVNDGILNITTTNVIDSPKFSAIEILNPNTTCTFTPTFTNTPTGTPPTPTFTPTFTATLPFSPIRVNCGGGQYVSSVTGFTWAADQAYTPGNWGYTTAGATNNRPTPVANTQDDPLYQTERWSNNQPQLNYAFDIPNGTYEITLKFNEAYFSSANQRRFNILLEGNLMQSNFDIVAEAGANWTAIDKIFNVDVSDGQLNVNLTQGSADWPLINAIQIIRLSPTPTMTFTTTFTPSRTPTFTATNTRTNTGTNTVTVTSTHTETNTSVPTNTQTSTRTHTPTNTMTNTQLPTNTVTNSSTFSVTASPTNTATSTRTSTLTFTPTNTATFTNTVINTATNTGTNTIVLTSTVTNTNTLTSTNTSTNTATGTRTNTQTPTDTATNTVTNTPTNTSSFTETVTGTQPPTWTNTNTPTQTSTFTFTQTNTATNTRSNTTTETFTQTNTATQTDTNTPVSTFTMTYTMTTTFTLTFTRTNTPSATYTSSATQILSATHTPSATYTPSATHTFTSTPTFISTFQPTPTLEGIGDYVIKNVLIYPQPLKTEERINLKFFTGIKFNKLKIKIYTVAFRKINEIQIDGQWGAGENTIIFNSTQLKNLSKGMYYYFIEVRTNDGKMIRSKLNKFLVVN